MNIKELTWIHWYGEECIGYACEDLKRDMHRICGQKTLVQKRGPLEAWSVVAGSADDSEFTALAKKEGLPLPEGWEQYVLRIETDRIYIAGSDARGTMWGIYRLSAMLGIPAGIRFSEVVEQPCENLPEGEYWSKPFTYKFRGWFLNDEDLLTQWHPGFTRELDYPFYQNITSLESLEFVVETALRMNMNLIIPASFMDIADPHQEVLVAYCARRGLFISQHHIEPLGVSHWYYQDYMKKLGKDTTYSYVTHKENAIEAWTYYAEKWAKYKDHVIWQLGLRGRGDRPIWDIDETQQDLQQWGRVISEAIEAQYEIVKGLCGDHFYSTSTLWMEGAELYQKGYLKFPKDTTLVFADVGPTQMMAPDFYEVERKPGTAYGIYYHVCYQIDGPHLCHGTDLRKMAHNYDLAVEKGDTEYSILNVSNVRDFILSIEANARLTADHAAFDVDGFYEEACRRYYGNALAAEVYKAYFDAFAELPDEELTEKYGKFFSFVKRYEDYEFYYCPATDGFLKTLGREGMKGTGAPYWPEKLEMSIRKFEEVLKLAESLSCNRYFDHMRWQIRYMILLENWCLHCCRYGQSRNRQELIWAVDCLDRIVDLEKEAEYGVWENWYRGEAKIGIRAQKEEALRLLER